MQDHEFCSLLACTIAAGAFTGDEDDAHREKIAKNAVDLAQKIDGVVSAIFEAADEAEAKESQAQVVEVPAAKPIEDAASNLAPGA